MTEIKAKTKWCPMKKFEYREPMQWEAQSQDEIDMVVASLKAAQDVRVQNMNCIASGCMMWRTRTVHEINEKDGIIDTSSDGYCGLGGNPL